VARDHEQQDGEAEERLAALAGSEPEPGGQAGEKSGEPLLRERRVAPRAVGRPQGIESA